MMFGEFNPDPRFLGIGGQLLSIIGHDCTCSACQENKERAVAALLYLLSVGTSIDFKIKDSTLERVPPGLRMLIAGVFGEDQEPSQAQGEKPAVPEFMIGLIRQAMEDPDMSPEKQAFINGWLESNGINL